MGFWVGGEGLAQKIAGCKDLDSGSVGGVAVVEDRFRVWELEVNVQGTWLRYEREVTGGFKNKARRSPAGCGCFLKVGGITPLLLFGLVSRMGK